MHRMPSLIAETHSSRAIASMDRVMPSAPPMPDTNMFSTLEWGKMTPSAHEVYTKVNEYTRPTPTVRFFGPRDDASAFAVSKEIKENRKVSLLTSKSGSRSLMVQVIHMITWQASNKLSERNK